MLYGLRVFMVFCFAVLLSGCGHASREIDVSKFNCPETGLIHEAEEVKFESDDGKEIVKVILHDFSGSCSVDKKGDLAVKVDAKLYFYAERNTGDTGVDRQDFKYFVTIISPENKILAKKVFSAAIDFDKEYGVGATEEEIEQIIPLAEVGQASLYKIVFGLQLTEEQFQEIKDKQ